MGLVGGNWLPFGLFSHINIGFISSSQLTKSYFSEGWPNHQPGSDCMTSLWSGLSGDSMEIYGVDSSKKTMGSGDSN